MSSIQEYLEEMRNIECHLLSFIEDEDKVEDNFQQLTNIFNEIKIHDDPHKLMSVLRLVKKISNNHHRNVNFFTKIFRILQFFENDIKKYYSNSEIFNIFRSNKRILLFLIEQKFMIIDEYIAKKITTTNKYIRYKYPQYFMAEIKPFRKEKWFPKNIQNQTTTQNILLDKSDKRKKKNKIVQVESWIDEINKDELPENFYENRKIGENESYICQSIRNDSVEEFIAYSKSEIFMSRRPIELSIYETNPLLLKENNYMEYAAFFGSIKIIQYLQSDELKPSLLVFAIHSQNVELIHYLEESHTNREEIIYKHCYKESIKCRNNDIMKYFQEKLPQEKDEEKKLQEDFIQNLKYYNFASIQIELINEHAFIDLCHYGYYIIANILLKSKDIDITRIINYHFNVIQNQSIQSNSKL